MKNFFLLILLLPLAVFGETLLVGHPSTLRAPYNFDRKKGVETELLNFVFKRANFDFKLIGLPHKRLLPALLDDEVQIIAPYKLSQSTKVYASKTFITFQNVLVTREGKQINNLQDLNGKRVVSFGFAKTALGPEFKKLAEKNPKWDFISDQKRQVVLLNYDRVDALIIDRHIFEYYREQIKFNPKIKIKYIKPFPETNYSLASKDKKVIERIDQVLTSSDFKIFQEKVYSKYKLK